MKKLDMIYEGKAKKVFKTDDDQKYIVDYKDDATAFNGVKKGTIVGKGVVNNKMSATMFLMLEEKGVKTHFLELLSDRESLVRAVQILPIEVIVRNLVAGSFAKRMGLEEGTEIKETILEFCYKNDELGDPLINDYHIYALDLASREQLEKIKTDTFKINEIMKGYFMNKGIRLVDFKLEFGLYNGEVILADEISPDTCRLWDIETNKKLDKDRFRKDLGQVEETYQEVLKRIQG